MGLAPQDWQAALEPDCRNRQSTSPRELTLEEVAWANCSGCSKPASHLNICPEVQMPGSLGLAQSPYKPSDPRAITEHGVQCSQTCSGYSAQVWDADSGVRTGHLSKVTFNSPCPAGLATKLSKQRSLCFFFFKWKNTSHMYMCISEVIYSIRVRIGMQYRRELIS